MPASLAPKKLHLALIFQPPDGGSTSKLHGWQSYLLKTVGGANLEGLLRCQHRWHPKNCIWHLFSNPQMVLFKKRRSTALRIGPESLTSGFQPNRTKFRPILGVLNTNGTHPQEVETNGSCEKYRYSRSDFVIAASQR